MKRNNLFVLTVSISALINPLASNAAQSPSIGDLQVFPADNPWHWDISNYSVHPNSDNFVASIGRTASLHPDFGTVWEGAPIGIPYCVVAGSSPLVAVRFTEAGDESDP